MRIFGNLRQRRHVEMFEDDDSKLDKAELLLLELEYARSKLVEQKKLIDATLLKITKDSVRLNDWDSANIIWNDTEQQTLLENTNNILLSTATHSSSNPTSRMMKLRNLMSSSPKYEAFDTFKQNYINARQLFEARHREYEGCIQKIQGCELLILNYEASCVSYKEGIRRLHGIFNSIAQSTPQA